MAANVWTYTYDPVGSHRDMIRFLIGDTDEADCQFSDSEIAYFIAQFPTNPRRAAIAAARTLEAKYSRLADEKAGRVEVKWSQRARAYAKLAYDIEKDLNSLTIPSLFTGGISKADIRIRRADPDRPDEEFYLHQDDNYQVRP